MTDKHIHKDALTALSKEGVAAQKRDKSPPAQVAGLRNIRLAERRKVLKERQAREAAERRAELERKFAAHTIIVARQMAIAARKQQEIKAAAEAKRAEEAAFRERVTEGSRRIAEAHKPKPEDSLMTPYERMISTPFEFPDEGAREFHRQLVERYP